MVLSDVSCKNPPVSFKVFIYFVYFKIAQSYNVFKEIVSNWVYIFEIISFIISFLFSSISVLFTFSVTMITFSVKYYFLFCSSIRPSCFSTTSMSLKRFIFRFYMLRKSSNLQNKNFEFLFVNISHFPTCLAFIPTKNSRYNTQNYHRNWFCFLKFFFIILVSQKKKS